MEANIPNKIKQITRLRLVLVSLVCVSGVYRRTSSTSFHWDVPHSDSIVGLDVTAALLYRDSRNTLIIQQNI